MQFIETNNQEHTFIANLAFLAANLEGFFVTGSVFMSTSSLIYFVRSFLIKFVYRAFSE